MNRDIARQKDLVQDLEGVINRPCLEQVLTSGIFQSNVYAKNWILGPQTSDQLIDEYAERSLLFDNVTNCPLSHPFFDGVRCTNCTERLPIFNIYTKRCEKCKYDTEIDNDLKRCVQKEHYSNFAEVENYNLDGLLTLP